MATTPPPAPASGTLVRDFRITRVAAPLRQSVVEVIRNAIASGQFAAGERLTEKSLCEMIGVSRTLVREALRQLESEGLILVVPNKGPVVASLSHEQAQQIYRVRSELEALAAELFAVNATEHELAELQGAMARLRGTIESNDVLEKVRAKSEFYECLVRGGNNEALGQVLSMLNSRITLLRATSLQHPGRWEKSVRELDALVKALAARDVAAARKKAVTHVANACNTALGVLQHKAR